MTPELLEELERIDALERELNTPKAPGSRFTRCTDPCMLTEKINALSYDALKRARAELAAAEKRAEVAEVERDKWKRLYRSLRQVIG